MATSRAKMRCTIKAAEMGGSRIELLPVYGDTPENRAFWEATPSGSVVLNIVNDRAATTFEPGREYYVDFTPAD